MRSIDWRMERKRIASLYKRGWTTRSIGKIFRTSHVTINKKLSEWGIQRRGSRKLRNTGRRGKFPRDRSYTGLRFGRLTVIGKHPVLYPLRWVCVCDCGKTVNLKEGQLKVWKSCGCKGKVPKGRRRKDEGIGKGIM